MSVYDGSDQPPRPVGGKWGRPIPEGRQQELQDLRTAWDARGVSAQDLGASGPFADTRLNGADVFWLMTDHWRRVTGESMSATHARLEEAHKDRSDEKFRELEKLEKCAGILNLNGANLEAADLTGAWLRHVSLTHAVLRYAHFDRAHLAMASINRVHAEGAIFHLAILDKANFANSILWRAHFEFASMSEASFEHSRVTSAKFQGAVASEASFRGARLAGTSFNGARLDGADLRGANFEREWWGVPLPPADLGPGQVTPACVEPINKLVSPEKVVPERLGAAVLARVKFDSDTTLANLKIGDREESVALADARYNGVSLAQIVWPRSPLADERVRYDARSSMLNDSLVNDPAWEELIATRVKQVQKEQRWWNKLRSWLAGVLNPRSRQDREGQINLQMDPEARETRRKKEGDRFAIVARANRQLAIALREQGIVETADYYSFRANRARQRELWIRGRYLGWGGLAALKVLAGYGYRPRNIAFAYGITIAAFMLVYITAGSPAHPYIPVWQAFVYSITAFHGRGVGLQQLTPFGEVASACEAVIGLVLEATFVVVVVQRMFGR
jgi:uncharacterized protein YjbI with pentapeptide repeats